MPTTNIDHVIAALEPEERAEVERLAAHYIAEETTRRELKKARELTSVRVAEQLGMTAKGVSRLEKRADMLMATMRQTVESMGGSLSIVAQFPNTPPVVLAGISEDPR